MIKIAYRRSGVVALLAAGLVALAYAVPTTMVLPLGRSLTSDLSVENFHDAEDNYRWSRARSEIRFRDPGASSKARLELTLAGFRPPGSRAPVVLVETPSGSHRIEPDRRIQTVGFDIETSGVWSSDLTIVLRSETFTPGAGDDRALGVRVHEARLIVDGPSWPALEQVLAGALATVAFFWLSGSLAATTVLAVVIASSYAFFRLEAALFVPVAALILIVLLGVRRVPKLERFFREAMDAELQALKTGARALITWQAAALAVIAVLGTVVAYGMTSRFELDLGSGHAAPILSRFDGPDRDGDTTFRRARSGATLDLRDFGASGTWDVTIHAAIETPGGDRRGGVLARSGDDELTTELDRTWRTVPWTLEPGPLLTFPGFGAGAALRIDRIVVERGRALPPLGPVITLVAMALLLLAAFRSTGASIGASSLTSSSVLIAVLIGLTRAPVLAIPFLGTLLFAAVAAWLVSIASRALVDVAIRRALTPELSPYVLLVPLAGFVAWFAATASPLYVGGHFVFHTNIAEEIWDGDFLLYYLPYPGSMLTRQQQWGNLIIPHPCLYHTVAAPLAAFSHAWFFTLTKLFLAFLLYWTALVSGWLATVVGNARAGAYGALAATFLPTGFQLLGLGHLMTLFGVWAAALALGFVITQSERLSERAIWWCALGLLSLCFLSYTGSLLFASLTLLAAAAYLFRSDRTFSTQLLVLVVCGWAAAFVLYYIHWTIPFITESLASLLTGSGSESTLDLGARIRALPRKLNYTFGTALIPIAGLAGLFLAQGVRRRTLLVCWGGILVVFSVADLAFNFILKHHYFTYPVIAVGVALLLERFARRDRIANGLALLFLVALIAMGLSEALDVASGRT